MPDIIIYSPDRNPIQSHPIASLLSPDPDPYLPPEENRENRTSKRPTTGHVAAPESCRVVTTTTTTTTTTTRIRCGQPSFVKMNNYTLPPTHMAAASLHIVLIDLVQSSSATLALGAVLAALMSVLAFLSYTPRIDKRAPAFTRHKHPLIGSADFMWHKNKFWGDAMQESKTGSFSFWIGKRHVVGLSGEMSRKMFMDTPGLDFVNGAAIRGVGVMKVPPVPEVFKPGFHNGRSYFLRRLIDMQKPAVLKKHLPRFTRDSRGVFDALAKDPSGVTNPAVACWRVVFSHDVILFSSDEIADNPKSFESLLHMIDVLQGTNSFTRVFFPWLPTMSGLKRARRLRYLQSIFEPVVARRMKKGAPRRDDCIQMLVDNGDKKDLIVDFIVSAIVIAPTNSRILIGQMLNIMGQYPHWQDKVYAEIQALAKFHAKDPNAPLAKQLDSMPFEAWETGFPSVDLCFKEAIRMWVAIAMMRRNISGNAIPIPGTNEVIPPGSFVIYNTTETHYSEELYPDPFEFKPERWLEGNVDANWKKQVYGFVGWGEGRHPCPAKRWARLQLNITVAYALAKFKWTSLDNSGHKKVIQEAGHGVFLPSKLSRYSLREKD